MRLPSTSPCTADPEADRHHFDVHPSERDLYETYLPAFQALVQEGDVAAVMGAYNRVYGESASRQHAPAAEDPARATGGSRATSCPTAIRSRISTSITRSSRTAEEAAALGVKNGCDLDCGKTYEALLPAVRQGLINESEIDAALHASDADALPARHVRSRPSSVRWAQIPYSVNQSPAARRARASRGAVVDRAAEERRRAAAVARHRRRIAVIGPTADDIMSLLGNYYGTPARRSRSCRASATRSDANTQRAVFARRRPRRRSRRTARRAVDRARVPASGAGSTQQGLKGEYFRGRDFAGAPVLTRVDSRIAFRWDRGAPTDDLVARGELATARMRCAGDDFSVRWTGQLLPPVSGTLRDRRRRPTTVSACSSTARVLIDGWELNERVRSRSAAVDLRGRPRVRRSGSNTSKTSATPRVRLAWRGRARSRRSRKRWTLARAADVIVFVGGLTGDVEGEEMKVNYPGFAGGDRTDLRLPASQRKLLEALHATGKPVVLVLTDGLGACGRLGAAAACRRS